MTVKDHSYQYTLSNLRHIQKVCEISKHFWKGGYPHLVLEKTRIWVRYSYLRNSCVSMTTSSQPDKCPNLLVLWDYNRLKNIRVCLRSSAVIQTTSQLSISGPLDPLISFVKHFKFHFKPCTIYKLWDAPQRMKGGKEQGRKYDRPGQKQDSSYKVRGSAVAIVLKCRVIETLFVRWTWRPCTLMHINQLMS